MKLCISYWSVEGGGAGTCPVDEAMDQAKRAGFDGIELAVGTAGVLSTKTSQKTCEQ
jgi:sugar phosphate isomerase/epimerase